MRPLDRDRGLVRGAADIVEWCRRRCPAVDTRCWRLELQTTRATVQRAVPRIGQDCADGPAVAERGDEQEVASDVAASERVAVSGAILGATNVLVLQEPDPDVVRALRRVLLHAEVQDLVACPRIDVLRGVGVRDVTLVGDVVGADAGPARTDVERVLRAGGVRRTVAGVELAVRLGSEVPAQISRRESARWRADSGPGAGVEVVPVNVAGDGGDRGDVRGGGVAVELEIQLMHRLDGQHSVRSDQGGRGNDCRKRFARPKPLATHAIAPRDDNYNQTLTVPPSMIRARLSVVSQRTNRPNLNSASHLSS